MGVPLHILAALGDSAVAMPQGPGAAAARSGGVPKGLPKGFALIAPAGHDFSTG